MPCHLAMSAKSHRSESNRISRLTRAALCQLNYGGNLHNHSKYVYRTQCKYLLTNHIRNTRQAGWCNDHRQWTSVPWLRWQESNLRCRSQSPTSYLARRHPTSKHDANHATGFCAPVQTTGNVSGLGLRFMITAPTTSSNRRSRQHGNVDCSPPISSRMSFSRRCSSSLAT